MVGRLEAGEDPNKIEERMGDMFGDEAGGPGGMGGYGDMGMGSMGMPSASAPNAETDAPASEKSIGKSKTIGMATGKNKAKTKAKTSQIDKKIKRQNKSKLL